MKKIALIILDGWGIGKADNRVNAIQKANTPFIDNLYHDYPNSRLKTSGLDVGLPEGQMGNSEVGHLNIGAGRVVYQQLVLINKAFEDNRVYDHKLLKEAFDHAKEQNRHVHLIGLVSDGGVHSSIDHLKHMCTLAKRYGVSKLFIHAFTDGRDTDPNSGISFIKELRQHIDKSTGKIASVVGRYYAMDRDRRWERTKKAYDMMVKGEGKKVNSAEQAILDSYKDGITDEFILPSVVTENGKPVATIQEGDVVINFNFRTDRGRQITVALTQQEFPELGMKPLKLQYITFTEYDVSFKDVKILFKNQNLKNTLGEIYEQQGLPQLRVAETEKYPHVTFFFSGGRETAFNGEERIMVASPKVATYDLKPEMSAFELTGQVIKEVNEKDYGLIVLNFANVDMVGHTGVFGAVVKAVETVDTCTEKIVKSCLEKDYIIIITSDHGNADFMINEDGSPNTAHTTNEVPIFLLNAGNTELENGRLADIAPTILKLASIPQPPEMDGKSLI